MSQIKYIFNNILLFMSLAVACALAGCQDVELYKSMEIPDVAVEVEGEIVFKPMTVTEIESRTTDGPEGANYKGIKSLYVFFSNNGEDIITDYTEKVTFTPVPTESETLQRVRFTKRVQAGNYYAYAVANISPNQEGALLAVKTVEELKNFSLDWDDNIEKDLEMFGVFGQDNENTIPGNTDFENDILLEITPAKKKIHSWVRRAASKVTVDFDGTGLKDNVTVYIKSAVLKDLPTTALLGANSAVASNNDLRQSDYALIYGSGTDHTAWTSVTNGGVDKHLSEAWKWKTDMTFHDDDALSLPCYENMQGNNYPEGTKWQDKNSDGIIDSKTKDGVELGTYLEVEGYYVSNRPEYTSQGKIIYRFMLGQDNSKDFNFKRNHHYKITMMFKDYGSDIDWHIEYAERYLEGTYPEDVNYQGKFFVPDYDYTYVFNAGHSFDNQNVITLTSYKTDGTNNTFVNPTSIKYTYYSYVDATGEWKEVSDTTSTVSKWLTTKPAGDVNEDNTQKDYTFEASMATPTSSTVNNLFPTKAVGSATAPYNLSSSDGTMTVENTANCYTVGAPGWYCLPLVYGNAITNKTTNSAAYASSSFVTHLGNQINAPYIKDNTGIDLSDVSVRIIWQDVDGLIDPTGETTKPVYDASLFGGKGGIKFHISTIQEGNAVIALIDNNASEDEYVNINRYDHFNKVGIYNKTDAETDVSGSTKAVWSWHIWATRFGFQFEKEIKLRTHADTEFDVMPVNLGWCAGDTEIRYYPRRKCKITFVFEDGEIERWIEQYPYFALPRGDHPYYQWGRKDPFVGTHKKATASEQYNKDRWTYDAAGNKTPYLQWAQYNPPRLYNEPYEEKESTDASGNKVTVIIEDYHQDNRHHTKDCLSALIKNPDKWHNAPRVPKGGENTDPTAGFNSKNQAPTDLWSLGGKKTVYDPCPPGYQVGDETVFTGFTYNGDNVDRPEYWYDVMEDNILSGYYDATKINSEVLEFYTDTRKLQSISFPVTGYRDYDARAGMINFASISFAWTNKANDVTNSTHLKLQRHDRENGWRNRGAYDWSVVGPVAVFFNTDGFAVRPVKTK